MSAQFDPILGQVRDGTVTLAEQTAGFNKGTAAEKAAFQASVSADLIIGTVTDLVAYTGTAQQVRTLGYYAAGDGGHGSYRLGSGSETADQGLVISGAGGRKWLLQHNGSVFAKQYGVMPDGVTNWESTDGTRFARLLAASLQVEVRWNTGYYATSINLDSTHSYCRMYFEQGSLFGGVLHFRGYDTVPATPTSLVRASGVVTATFSSAHGIATGSKIRLRRQTGTSSTSFETIGAVATAASTTVLTWPQAGANETLSSGCGEVRLSPLYNSSFLGYPATTDRFGLVNAYQCEIGSVRVVSDPTRHSAYPGTTCRGAHIYVGAESCHITELIIDDAAGSNTDAALAIDGGGDNPSGLRIDRVVIKDSGYHGAYITGLDHQIGDIVVQGFGRLTDYTGTLQDSNGSAQSAEMCGVWLNRMGSWLTTGSIKSISVAQPTGTARTYKYAVRLDETGIYKYADTWYKDVSIGSIDTSGCGQYGSVIGDVAGYESTRTFYKIGQFSTSLASSGLSSGAFGITLHGALQCYVDIGSIKITKYGSANKAIRSNNRFAGSVGTIDVFWSPGQILYNNNAKLRVDNIVATFNSTSYIDQMVQTAGTNQFSIGSYRATPLAVSDVGLFGADANAANWSIGEVVLSADPVGVACLRKSSGMLTVAAGGSNWRIGRLSMDSILTYSNGPCLVISGAQSGFYIGDGSISRYVKGVSAASTPAFTNGSAMGLTVSGNTTNTDVAAGAIGTSLCSGVTL